MIPWEEEVDIFRIGVDMDVFNIRIKMDGIQSQMPKGFSPAPQDSTEPKSGFGYTGGGMDY